MKAIGKKFSEYFDDSGELLRGRREIMAFLKVKSWKTVKRYQKKYNLPILRFPGGRPVALRSVLIRYIIIANELMEKRKKDRQKGPSLTPL